MDRFWKAVCAVAILIAIYVAFEQRSAQKIRKARVQQMAALFDRGDFDVKAPQEMVHHSFYRALWLLNEFRKPEVSRLFARASAKEPAWYLEEALAAKGYGDVEKRLISLSLQEAIEDCEAAGVFADEVNAAALESGEAPVAIQGPFAGERLRIGYLVTPLAAIELINHPANLKLLPATVWALQLDRLDQTALGVARDFRDARVLDPAVMQRLEETWKTSQKNN
ncbi:MAG: hypothetical protein ACR2OZ_18830 [Verrucomicrobiales bacterium]